MPPRIPLRPRLHLLRTSTTFPSHICCGYASVAATSTATTPAYPSIPNPRSTTKILRYPSTQPPSHKPPEVRKTQLHRAYQSLLKSSPLLLLFQHNNIRAIEWMGIRRELARALQKVDEARQAAGNPEILGEQIRLQIIQTAIFASALKIVEFYKPPSEEELERLGAGGQTAAAKVFNTGGNLRDDPRLVHGLSRRAWRTANKATKKGLHLDLEPLLSGPLAVVAFPAVAPDYLKAVLSILAPSSDFPAPKRKANPSYHEPDVQYGLQKLMLLGARVEGKGFDVDGTKWVGGIEGGLDGLRAQLVHMLQSVGGSITNALEGVSRSLYFTVEGHRMQLEDEQKPKEEKKE